jgi:tricorn protease
MAISRASAILSLLAFTSTAAAAIAAPPLLHSPSVSTTQVVFTYGDDIWSAPRAGGEAHPLTTGPGTKVNPVISPDGKWIAYSATIDGNTDVYVIPSSGGMPRRVTHHPDPDGVIGWTPDGTRVLFRSARNSYARQTQLFTVGVDGGLPAEIPLPEAVMGSFSADGKQLAYVPVQNFQAAWKRYRGGSVARIWIATLADSSTIAVPRDNSNDTYPMWIGDTIYFVSDRSGPATLFSYDTRSKRVEQALPSNGTDIKYASANGSTIVYEQLGAIRQFDTRTGRTTDINITVAGDLPNLRPHFEPVAQRISAYGISPTGARAVFEARGEILTVPADKGDIRNLTNTPGAAERDPAWSPDGKWIAYFSDESGEYELHVKAQDGVSPAKTISLGTPPSFFYKPTWSPDSKLVAYCDKRLNLWYVDIAKGTPVKVDTDYYDHPERSLDPRWSPDSRWITYTKRLPSQMHAVFAYSIESGKSRQITDGLSDARYAAFDRNGKYLYFTASTDSGPSMAWLDLSSFGRNTTRAAYLVVLKKDEPSPLAPESDEEKAAPEPNQDKPQPPIGGAQKPDEKTATPSKPPDTAKPGAERDAKVTVDIDFDRIGQRILSLPIPQRQYTFLIAGATGTLFLGEAAPGVVPSPEQVGDTVYRFELSVRRANKLLDGVRQFAVSADGKKMLYQTGAGPTSRWLIASVPPPTPPGPTPAEGAAGGPGGSGPGGSGPGGSGPRISGEPLRLDSMTVAVDPRAEFRQMYHETWRIERDFLYDPNLHGLNWKDADRKYEPYVDAVASRADLTYLFNEMLGEITLGHVYVNGPPPLTSGGAPPPRTGLLGADYRIENGRYRFAKVYLGENWNPGLRAPLTEPGVNVNEGDYLLEVNGRDLRGTDEIFKLFEGTAEHQVLLKVGPDPTGKGARTVTVVPIASEAGLRNREWMDGNRRKVDELSGGRLAYVYLPNTAGSGFTNFNRYYFAQVGREGVIVDERFNGGGQIADYVIDQLRRPVSSYWTTREGHDFSSPFGSIYGPKVMITNMYAGSGGDAMPWMFRHEKLGPLVGTRTWGGLVGIYDYPRLIDGGTVTAPRVAFYSPEGEWDVENRGVAPDYEVDFTPKAWREGHDPQLEQAVQLALDQLKKQPLPIVKRPPYPNYQKASPAITSSERTKGKQ